MGSRFVVSVACACLIPVFSSVAAEVQTEEPEVLDARDSQTAASRCLALLAVVGRAHTQPGAQVLAWVEKNGIDRHFSARERAVFHKRELTPAEKAQFSWRAEALVSLLWALGAIKDFPNLTEQYDVYQLPAVRDAIADPKTFVSNAKLRAAKEIEDMEAVLYHQHWRVRDAQLFGKPMPPDLNPDIVYERRYGLSWLVGWGDDWDEVPTDT